MMRVGIAGGGILGRLLALRLVEVGCDVSVFDQDDIAVERGASMAAAGMLAATSELERGDQQIARLGMDSLHLWPSIINQLSRLLYFQQTGSIVVAHMQDNQDLERFIAVVNKNCTPDQSITDLNTKSLIKLEPELSAFKKAYYFPDEAHLDNQTLMRQLGLDLSKQGIHWQLNHKVDAVLAGEIIVGEAVHAFDYVFDCRGMGGVTYFKHLRPVRGELIWLYAPSVVLYRPVRLIHPRYRLYIVPRPGHYYLIGASEIEANDDSPISVGTMLELLSAAYSVHKGFLEARIMKTVTGIRPTLPDNLPSIQYTDKMIAINGLYRHGFLIAPALVEDVIRYLTQGSSARKYTDIWGKMHDRDCVKRQSDASESAL